MIDIDDTIQISDVHDRKRLVRRAFIDKDREPVEGMPELYRSFITRLGHTEFFYLSASPSLFYGSINHFISRHYPHGKIILRDMNFLQLSRFFWNLKPVGVLEYKIEKMNEIHKQYPTHLYRRLDAF